MLRRVAEASPVGKLRARLEEIEQGPNSVLSMLGLRIPSDASPEMLCRLVNEELKELRRRLESELGKLRERSSILNVENSGPKGSSE